jgi:hypothetical protein
MRMMLISVALTLAGCAGGVTKGARTCHDLNEAYVCTEGHFGMIHSPGKPLCYFGFADAFDVSCCNSNLRTYGIALDQWAKCTSDKIEDSVQKAYKEVADAAKFKNGKNKLNRTLKTKLVAADSPCYDHKIFSLRSEPRAPYCAIRQDSDKLDAYCVSEIHRYKSDLEKWRDEQIELTNKAAGKCMQAASDEAKSKLRNASY